MNQKSIFFIMLSAEESAVISGGEAPTFAPSWNNPTQEGTLYNADGNGKNLTISTGAKSSNSSNSNLIDPVSISLPAQTQNNSTTAKMY